MVIAPPTRLWIFASQSKNGPGAPCNGLLVYLGRWHIGLSCGQRWLCSFSWTWVPCPAIHTLRSKRWSLVGGLEHFFHNVWDNPSHWLIFFKMVKTTNKVRESSGACMITVEKGYWSPCMRETWMPHVNICGDDGCDVHSTGTGVCSVRVDGAAYSLTHCGVFPAPAVNQAQGKDVHLFCPAAVPIAVFPILKCASARKG